MLDIPSEAGKVRWHSFSTRRAKPHSSSQEFAIHFEHYPATQDHRVVIKLVGHQAGSWALLRRDGRNDTIGTVKTIRVSDTAVRNFMFANLRVTSEYFHRTTFGRPMFIQQPRAIHD